MAIGRPTVAGHETAERQRSARSVEQALATGLRGKPARQLPEQPPPQPPWTLSLEEQSSEARSP